MKMPSALRSASAAFARLIHADGIMRVAAADA